MDVSRLLAQLGGIASRHELLAIVTRAELEAAVRSGRVVRVTRGRYALPTADGARAAAQRLTGVAVLQSAAAGWGWRLKTSPDRPVVAVPRGRRIRTDPGSVRIRWQSIPADQVRQGWLTSPVRTVLDCAAALPFDEALAVADSALRHRSVGKARLVESAGALSVHGHRTRVLRVVRAADARAANPLESVVRAIALGVPGLQVQPQVVVRDAAGVAGRVDLMDRRLGIVVEAEGYEFHGHRDEFERDCLRYNRLATGGLLVLRIPWGAAMHDPDGVRHTLAAAVARRARPADDRT